MEALNQSTGERAFFLAERWLDRKSGTVAVLEPAAGGAQAKQQYKVRGLWNVWGVTLADSARWGGVAGQRKELG